MTVPACPKCHANFTVSAFLSGASGYSRSTQSGQLHCPACQAHIEFRVSDDRLEFGYASWGGSLHFDAMTMVAVAGLRLLRDEDSFVAELDGAAYPLSPPSSAAR